MVNIIYRIGYVNGPLLTRQFLLRIRPGWSPTIQRNGLNQAINQIKQCSASRIIPSIQSKDHLLPCQLPVYILGLGSIGKFIAHSLLYSNTGTCDIQRRTERHSSVHLIFHRKSLHNEWIGGQQTINLIPYVDYTQNGHSVGTDDIYLRHGGFACEYCPPIDICCDHKPHTVNPSTNSMHIQNLIVTVPAYATCSALLSVRHRLNHLSTVAFIQNGMGILEQVNQNVFPDIKSRPSYIQGVISHGVTSIDPWSVKHTGNGTLHLALLPRNTVNSFTLSRDKGCTTNYSVTTRSSTYLMDVLCLATRLKASKVKYDKLFQLQLEKLAVNCVINPLTVLVDARNGTLLANGLLLDFIRSLTEEISFVIRSLPEVRNNSQLRSHFLPRNLELKVVDTAERTKANYSSMLSAIRRGAPTEIDYLNGYILRRASELGIKCNLNQFLRRLVLARSVHSHGIA